MAAGRNYPKNAELVIVSTRLVRESVAYEGPVTITDSEKAAEAAIAVFELLSLDREVFAVLALNTKNRIVGAYKVAEGSLNATIVHPRECFKTAVMLSAASVVMVHNHPSGDTTPSGADVQLTRRLVKAGDILGIEVLDHVVVGTDGNTSMREVGLM